MPAYDLNQTETGRHACRAVKAVAEVDPLEVLSGSLACCYDFFFE